MKKVYKNLEDIRIENNIFQFTPEEYSTENKYPILISDYYLKLIDRNNYRNDPIWKQCFPNKSEITDNLSSEDPLYEEIQMPVNRLIHRYKDRAVLLSTNRCTTHCRFCFRKRYWKKDIQKNDIAKEEIQNICKYLSKTSTIREILISGGDPLILSPKKLKMILDSLFSVGTIEIVRIATRTPVTMPSLINKDLVNLLSKYTGLWLVTHFNHPKELTDVSLKACKLITDSGIPILNQTVLLKGINDDKFILETLFRSLAKYRIKPLYLFHIDPVQGVRHFATGIDAGIEIMKHFRNNLSSIATPSFAIDLPEGGGKVSLLPDYRKNDSFLSLDNSTYIEYKT